MKLTSDSDVKCSRHILTLSAPMLSLELIYLVVCLTTLSVPQAKSNVDFMGGGD
jgi:hypothetical protein